VASLVFGEKEEIARLRSPGEEKHIALVRRKGKSFPEVAKGKTGGVGREEGSSTPFMFPTSEGGKLPFCKGRKKESSFPPRSRKQEKKLKNNLGAFIRIRKKGSGWAVVAF